MPRQKKILSKNSVSTKSRSIKHAPTNPQPTRSDAFFHRVAMNTTEEIEKKDLDALSVKESFLAEQQIIRFLDAEHRDRALLGFQQLVSLYPNDPKRPVWEGLIRMLHEAK